MPSSVIFAIIVGVIIGILLLLIRASTRNRGTRIDSKEEVEAKQRGGHVAFASWVIGGIFMLVAGITLFIIAGDNLVLPGLGTILIVIGIISLSIPTIRFLRSKKGKTK